MPSVSPAPDPDPPTAPAVSPRRPWHRLHASTRVVAGLVLAVFVILAVPAYEGEEYVSAYDFRVGKRGWPFTVVELTWSPELFGGTIGDLPSDRPGRPEWLIRSSWTYSGDVDSYSLTAGVANGFVALAILAGTAAVFEAWRRRRHRLWQFYLNDLVGLTVVVAAASAWFGWWYKGHADEQRLLQSISNLQGRSELPTVDERFVGPAWVRRLLGYSLSQPFRRVVSLWLPARKAGPVVSARIAEQVSQFAWLKEFIAGGGSINDEVIRALCSSHRLTSVALFRTSITDASLAILARQEDLVRLDLTDCRVTRAGLAHLRELERLEYLTLRRSHLTDADLEPLTKIMSLHWLDLSQNPDITLAGLHSLSTLPSLGLLVLDDGSFNIVALKRALPNVHVSRAVARFAFELDADSQAQPAQ